VALGFAVNNSGLIVCPRAIGKATHAKNMSSNRDYPCLPLARGNMLQAVNIGARTYGLIPAYREQPDFDESLYSFDIAGELCELVVDSLDLEVKIDAGTSTWLLRDGFMARFTPPRTLFGGPIFNRAKEVMGIGVAASESGFLVVQPWSTIAKCIKLNVGTWRSDAAT
jgi:hypothetical protein